MTTRQYLRAYRSLWDLGVVLVAAGPLALWVPNLQPPWPEGSQIITTLFCVVVAILSASAVRQFARRSSETSRSERQRTRAILWVATAATAFGLVAGIYYLIAFNRYVVIDEQTVGSEVRAVRMVIGNQLQREADGNERPLRLLREHGYDPEAVWTRESVLRTRFLVFASFVSTFVPLTIGLALLAALPSRRSAGRASRKV